MEDYYDDLIDYVFELPDRGIADKFMSEFYQEEERNSLSTSEGLESQRPLMQRLRNRLPKPRPILKPEDLRSKLRPDDSRPTFFNLDNFPNENRRAANIPDNELDPEGDLSTGGSEIREVVNSLKDLIQLLNSTDQGRTKLKRIKHKLFPLKHKHAAMMNMFPMQKRPKTKPKVADVLLNGFNPVLLSLSGEGKPALNTNTKVNPFQGLKTKGGTIPPHIIPLGPDGNPIINSDGSLVSESDYSVYKNKLEELFPYLNANTTDLTKSANDELTSTTESTTEIAEVVDKDPFSAMIDTIHDLPMETRQHMMANMMFMVPMAALSMVAAGVPQLAIAPLALVIPGFLFAAFTETGDGTTTRRGGHGHHGHHGQADTSEDTAGVSDHPHNRHGISGLIAGVREFYQQGLDTDTLHIRTRPQSRQFRSLTNLKTQFQNYLYKPDRKKRHIA